MVRKTRSTTIKTTEKIRKESPRRTRRRRSTSKSGDSDEEVHSKKDQYSNQSEKGSTGNESDTDSKKPLKKRNISIAVSSSKKSNNSDTKSSNKGDQQDEGEEVIASKGKSKSISMSNNDDCKPEFESENVQVTEESPNDENADNVASDELSKNGTEASEIDVNISQSIVAEMTCDNQSSEITTELSTEIVVSEQSTVEQANIDENLTQANPEEAEQKTKEAPPRSRPSRFSDGPIEEGVANKNTSSESVKKIKLNRLPRDKKSSTSDKDDAKDDKEAKRKLITLKRPENKQSPVEDPNKQLQETQEPLPKEEQTGADGWGSTYELGSEEKDEKSSRRKITLKRTTVDEKSNEKDLGRSISLQETSERETSTSADNIVIINERRRHSTGAEKSSSETEEKLQKPKKPTKTVKLIRTLPTESVEPPPPGEEQAKKYKWSNLEVSHTAIEPLNLETLQELCSNIEFLNEADVDLEIDSNEKKSPEKVKGKTFLELEEEEMENIEAELNAEPEKLDVKENIIAMNRKISIVEDTASKLKPPPSPAKNPVSDVLFITNLVRPFTVKQLKELLERTGKIREDGFWTDKIKSKCYVQYETIDQAESTRNALHGVHWPIGNGKKLVIDYATVQDMENAKNPPPIVVPKKEKSPEKENKKPEIIEDKLDRREVSSTKREWDVGKESDLRRRRSRSKSRERRERKHSRRSYTPEDHHIKKRKHEEPAPQKAMDDLFLKTKATPSIYWQPLSPEEIARKQQQRQARLEENKRRLEEIRSSARSGPRDRSGRDRNFRRR